MFIPFIQEMTPPFNFWGNDDSDFAEILDSGDWLDLRKKMFEKEQDSSSPTSPLQAKRKMPASKSNGPPMYPRGDHRQ